MDKDNKNKLNVFKNGENKAAQTQETNKAAATGKAPLKPARKTVRINISLAEETNKKLSNYSAKTGISKSSLIQLWINQNCD